MGTMANIVCKTVGLAGMSTVVYDAYCVGKKKSKRASLQNSADTYESIIASTKTASTGNPSSNVIRNKISDMRMKNPIIPIIGRVNGFITGALNSVTDNFIPVICSSLALACKGTWAKIGAWGLAGWGAFTILREGFGLGKETPVE